jgi:DNA-binding response OmpR family regulator
MHANVTLLIVEDDPATRTFLADNLTADGFDLHVADNTGDALRLLETKAPDLAIVDVGLPDGSGLDLIAQVRNADRLASRLDPEQPFLVVSGRAGELDRLRGFARGCDDYVVKPFSYPELLMRIRALLRRANPRPRSGRLRVGDLELDPLTREVQLRGARLDLSQKEFALLRIARVRARSGVHEGGAAARRVGLSRARRHQDPGQSRVSPAQEARRARRPVRDERLGRRVSPRRPDGRAVIGAALLAGLLGWVAAAALALRARRRRELVARASHELRGPLTAAQLALDTMARRRDVHADHVLAIDSQLRRARLALADFDAAPAGVLAPDDLAVLPVSGLVAQLALSWEPVAAARGRELKVPAAPPGLSLLGDRTRLAQAAGNLLANALEHGAGPVELRARRSGPRLRLEVRDSGTGLPAPVSELVRSPRGGRGRGLAITAGIAARHGGRLTAAPSAAGASVVLELPLHAAPEALEAHS